MDKNKELINPANFDKQKIYTDILVNTTEIIENIYKIKIKTSIKLNNFVDLTYPMVDCKGGQYSNENYGIEIQEYSQVAYMNDYNFCKNIISLDIFFDSLGINDFAIANYIYLILHEIGHVTTQFMFYENRNDINGLNNAIESVNQIIASYDKDDNAYNHMLYSKLQFEAEADRFAFLHFPMVWNMLKDKYNLE